MCHRSVRSQVNRETRHSDAIARRRRVCREGDLEAELLMDRMVVPAGTPVPVTISPSNSPVVVMPVTMADPLVSVPVRTVD